MELRGIFLFFFPSFLLEFRNFSYLGGEESFSLTSNNTFGLGIVNETRFSSFRSPFNHREARRATPLSLLPERLAISLFSETWRGDCNEKSPEQKETLLFPVRGNLRRPFPGFSDFIACQ